MPKYNKEVFNFFLDLFFPRFCCGCNSLGTYLCPNCYNKLYFFLTDIEIETSVIYLDKLNALVKYQPPIDQLIFDFKYQGVKEIGLTCAQMLYYASFIPKVDVISFIPLTPKKEELRGFNQAQIIAQKLSTLTNIPLVTLLERKKEKIAQASILDKKVRMSNAENLYFPLEQNIPPNISSCLLIDDVSTTGATLNQCAKVLKQSGIQKVYGLSFAHG